MISYHKGNLLESGCDIICHQCNLQGIMGGGLAKQIATKYPKCEKEYNIFSSMGDAEGKVMFFEYEDNGEFKVIANCFSQERNFETNYAWVRECFEKVKDYAKEKNLKTIGVPFKYGCGIAHGDWNDVEQIFVDLFENEESELQIWEL